MKGETVEAIAKRSASEQAAGEPSATHFADKAIRDAEAKAAAADKSGKGESIIGKSRAERNRAAGKEVMKKKPRKYRTNNNGFANYAQKLSGKKISEAERLLDKDLLLKGWIKAPLKRGDGLRYYDGKGNAISLNKGYPDRLRSGDAIHGKPYAKIEPYGIRMPLNE